MIKLTHYINPANNQLWSVSIEYINEENKPVFKAYYDEFTINLTQSTEWQNELKDNTGQNIAFIYINENPDD